MTFDPPEFETLLDQVAAKLGEEVRQSTASHAPDAFQRRVFELLVEAAAGSAIQVNPTFHPHAFPDIRANGYGIEVKTTTKDTWVSVGNSVFEGMRDPSVTEIYVIFGKLGGLPSVRWGHYEDRITHVRISHAPRFVIEMERDASLFKQMGISYSDFSKLSPDEKMRYVRDYSRRRLQPGERLWWLEDERQESGIPLQVRLYMRLTPAQKIRMRAEAALLCPQVCGPPGARDKYNDAALFLLTYHGVFAPQTRDLFSAGSVAYRASAHRGGQHVLRALLDIEDAMRDAARHMENALFEEYWGAPIPPAERLLEWLIRADAHAKGWQPSDHLFLREQGRLP
ncbi:MAG: restriction endonuclease [Acidobacteriota bacterium]